VREHISFGAKRWKIFKKCPPLLAGAPPPVGWAQLGTKGAQTSTDHASSHILQHLFKQPVISGDICVIMQKFHQNWPNGFGDIAIFHFSIFKMAAICHLGFKIFFKHLVTCHVGILICIVVPNFIKIGHGC